MVEGRRRLHGRDPRRGARDTRPPRTVAGLATEALAEHPDATVGERLRGKPLDQVVRVATRLPEAPVVPPSARIAHPAEDGTSVSPPRGEEVGLAEVEVTQHHVRRELHDDAREPSPPPARHRARAVQLAGDRDPVVHRDRDRRPDDVVPRRPVRRPTTHGSRVGSVELDRPSCIPPSARPRPAVPQLLRVHRRHGAAWAVRAPYRHGPEPRGVAAGGSRWSWRSGRPWWVRSASSSSSSPRARG